MDIRPAIEFFCRTAAVGRSPPGRRCSDRSQSAQTRNTTETPWRRPSPASTSLCQPIAALGGPTGGKAAFRRRRTRSGRTKASTIMRTAPSASRLHSACWSFATSERRRKARSYAPRPSVALPSPDHRRLFDRRRRDGPSHSRSCRGGACRMTLPHVPDPASARLSGQTGELIGCRRRPAAGSPQASTLFFDA